MRYAIYGAGSLGTVLGAFITKAGTEIDLVNRNPQHVAALNECGARVTGPIEMTVPVRAVTPDGMEGLYDAVLLLTKQQHNKEAAEIIKKHLAEDGVVATLQNGIPEPGWSDRVNDPEILA